MTEPPEGPATPDPWGTPPPPEQAATPTPAWPTPPSPYAPPQPYAQQQPYAPYGAPAYGLPPAPARPAQSGLYVAAAVINWVTLAILVGLTCGIGLIAAAWFVPMTIFIHKGASDGRKHTALGVCTLLFCNVLSGIFMLVEDSNRPSA